MKKFITLIFITTMIIVSGCATIPVDKTTTATVVVESGTTITGSTTTDGTKETTPSQTPNNEEASQDYKTLYISIGEEFTLHENQIAMIENENYKIKITQFFNSPCPKGVACIWSGIGIAFEYTSNGEVTKGVNLVQAFGYQTTVIDTDYKSYAKLKITKIE